MAASTSPLRGRIHYLDGLRAIAVLSVVIHHAALYDGTFPEGLLKHVLVEGAHGVDLFFVISGFVLSYPVLAKLEAEGAATLDVAKYLAHRFIRILPPYFFAVGFCTLLLYCIGRWHLVLADGIIDPHVTPLEVLKQLFFLDQRTQFVNVAFWSLAVEFRWYFLFPLLLLLWTRSPRAFGLVGLAFVALAHLTRVATVDVFTMPAFMLGIVAAAIQIRQLPIRRYAGLLCLLALGIAILVEPKIPDFSNKIQVWWQVACFFFVVAAGAYPWLRASVSVAPLVAIGIISYSVYLVSGPLEGLVVANTTWGFFGAVAIGVGVGAIFWALFERPFMATALKGTLTEKLQPPLSRALTFFGIPNEMHLQKTPSEAADAAGAEAGETIPAQPASAPTIAGS
jgi:peptidoglycan/LPS O-acetylase OafA/YrhL